MNEYPQVRIVDIEEILAVWRGEMAGDYYSDDETWASVADLARYRREHCAEEVP